MKLTAVIGAIFAILWGPAAAMADVGCLPNSKFESAEFSGEVYGDQDYAMGHGFRQLTLSHIGTGWEIGVRRADQSVAPTRPPSSGAPGASSLWVVGQDFGGGTIINTMSGSTIRKFVFGNDSVDPALNPDMTTPQKHGNNPPNIAAVEPTEGELGIGELIVEDIGLTDLGAGLTPRLTYLKFSGCLGWHRGYRGADWRMGSDPGVPDRTVSVMKQCGFDDRTYTLSDRTTKWGEGGSDAYLELDMNGNGTLDFIAPVLRRDDGRYGLALCQRGENRLRMLGFDAGSRDIGDFTELGGRWFVRRAPVKPGPDRVHPAGHRFVMGLLRGPEISVFLDRDDTLHIRRQRR